MQKPICYMLLVKVTCKIGSRLEMLAGDAKRSRFSSTRKTSTGLKSPVNSNLQCSAKVKRSEDRCLYRGFGRGFECAQRGWDQCRLMHQSTHHFGMVGIPASCLVFSVMFTEWCTYHGDLMMELLLIDFSLQIITAMLLMKTVPIVLLFGLLFATFFCWHFGFFLLNPLIKAVAQTLMQIPYFW